MAFNFTLKGIFSNVLLGKGGIRIKNNGGILEAKNNADDAFVKIRAANPEADNDVVNKKYLESYGVPKVTGQIDGGSPPAVVNGAVYIVTTTGGAYTTKELWRGEGGSWVEITPLPEGMRMTVTDDLSGGTDEYEADHLYVWDADGSEWVDIGVASIPTTATPKYVEIDYEDTVADTTFGAKIPQNAVIDKVLVKVTTAFDDTAPQTLLVETDQDDSLIAVSEVDLTTVGVYEATCFHKVVTVGGENVQYTLSAGNDDGTQGAASILVVYHIVDAS